MVLGLLTLLLALAALAARALPEESDEARDEHDLVHRVAGAHEVQQGRRGEQDAHDAASNPDDGVRLLGDGAHKERRSEHGLDGPHRNDVHTTPLKVPTIVVNTIILLMLLFVNIS